MTYMARVYAELIKKSMKTINDVPENLKAEVEMILESEAKKFDK